MKAEKPALAPSWNKTEHFFGVSAGTGQEGADISFQSASVSASVSESIKSGIFDTDTDSDTDTEGLPTAKIKIAG